MAGSQPPWQSDFPPPMSAPPTPAAPGRGSKIGLIIVSVVAVLLLGFGGLMTYFWLDTSTELDETRADLTSQVENLTGTVANRDELITTLEDRLQQSQDDVDNLQTQLEGSQGEVEHLEEAVAAIGTCLDKIEEWLVLITVLDDIEAADELFEEELEPACDEAEQYR